MNNKHSWYNLKNSVFTSINATAIITTIIAVVGVVDISTPC